MIRFVFRWVFRALLLAIVLVVSVLLLKDHFARSYSEQQIRRSTGFDVKIGKVQVGLLEPRLTIENLVLYNPPEFGGSPFLDAPDIHLEYAPGPLTVGQLHLKFLRLTIRELNIVESNGRTNIIDFLKKVTSEGSTSTRPEDDSNGFAGIDLLNLSIGKIRYSDLDRPRRNQEITLGLQNHIVRNVRSQEDFANLLLKLLFRAGVSIYVDDKPRAKPTR